MTRHLVTVLVALLACAASGRAAEVVSFGSGPEAWKLETQGGAAATIREDQGAMRIDITNRGSQNWHVQLYQGGKYVRDTTVCTLRFTAKASQPRRLVANSQTAESPWRQMLKQMPAVDLTTEWRPYSVQLTFKESSDATLRVPIFVLGDAAGTVWFKDVTVVGAAGGSEPAQPARPAQSAQGTPPASADGNLLANPMDAANWKFAARDGARATLKSEAGMLRVDIPAPGTAPQQVQMHQMAPSLVAGRAYFLTLHVRSTAARTLVFTAQQEASPNASLLPATALNIGPEWKLYKLRFTLNEFAPGQTRLPVLQMGDAAGTVFFQAISLEEAPAVSAR